MGFCASSLARGIPFRGLLSGFSRKYCWHLQLSRAKLLPRNNPIAKNRDFTSTSGFCCMRVVHRAGRELPVPGTHYPRFCDSLPISSPPLISGPSHIAGHAPSHAAPLSASSNPSLRSFTLTCPTCHSTAIPRPRLPVVLRSPTMIPGPTRPPTSRQAFRFS